jgi:hypothetical protein
MIDVPDIMPRNLCVEIKGAILLSPVPELRGERSALSSSSSSPSSSSDPR